MKKLFALGLSLSLVLSLAACASKAPVTQTTPTPATTPAVEETTPNDETPTTPVEAELTLHIPDEYVDLLTINTEGSEYDTDHIRTILKVSETASIEAGEVLHPGEDWGDGWLFDIVAFDQIGYEAFMSGYHNTETIFAKNEETSTYYVFQTPSDVRLMREGDDIYTEENLEAWGALNEWAATVPETLIADNGLVAFDQQAALKGNIFEGEHIEYLYLDPAEDSEMSVIISLGQPTGAGEGKIWTVDYVSYSYTPGQEPDVMRAYPAGIGIEQTAADYYASLQEQADAGSAEEYLTAEGALEMFINTDAWLVGDTDMAHFSVLEAAG